ncbi:hypothetical protein [Jiella avicenniae]|uniref:Uncharacterized protein n=1 Tax=Jiella avicenniae TaxID=2907202 RepID=A0A9X1P4K7_9HYPH|nr:hypothetical protein [Jiella avicenniae]MCE7029659.1 hypothetical protein [Jiella avicenniae]
MTVHLEQEICEAIEHASHSGVLLFHEAAARIHRHMAYPADAALAALVERRILSEARIRKIPVLFTTDPHPILPPPLDASDLLNGYADAHP